MTALLLPHMMGTIGPFIRLEEFLFMAEHGLGVERQESATTLQRGPDERAVAWYCSPVV